MFRLLKPLSLAVVVCIATCCWGPISAAATRYEQVIRNGDFESLVIDAQTWPRWQIWPSDAASSGNFSIERQAGAGRNGSHALKITRLKETEKGVVLFQFMADPSRTLEKGKMYIGSIWAKGTTGAQIAIESVPKGGKAAIPEGGKVSVNLSQTDTEGEWRRFEFRAVPERNMSRLKFVVVVWEVETLWIDDVSFLAPLPEPKETKVEPPNGLDWSYEAMWKQTTATRQRLCLNGYWKFQPADGVPTEIPESNWGYMHVPGYWAAGFRWGQDKHFKVWGSDKGEDTTWRGKLLLKYPAGWFQRQVHVPADWQGRHVFMELNQVDPEAVVYWNGQRVGQAHYLEGAEIDVTNVVQPGKANQVTILIKDVPQKSTIFAGISGNIFLEAAKPAPRIGRCRVVTSIKDRRITVAAVIEGNEHRAKAMLECVVEDDGKAVATWRQAAPQQLGPGEHDLTVSGDVQDVRLWELEDSPALYDLRLRLIGPEGSILDEKLVRGRGFRDFKIKGRQFILNGLPCRLRVTLLCDGQRPYLVSGYAIRDFIRNMKDIGYNAIYVWSQFAPGHSAIDISTVLTEADRQGIAIYCSMPGVGFMRSKTEKDETRWAQCESWTRALVDRYGRHPSVLAYVTNINYPVYHGTGQDPSKMDGVYYPKGDPTYDRNRKYALEWLEYLRSLDPTKPVIDHDGCNLGDVYSQNSYLSWTPLQEKEEWLSLWADKGVKPLVVGEYGAPSHIAYNFGRPGPSTSLASERVMTEYCAMYLGEDAYRLEEDEYVRTTTENHYKGGEKYGPGYWYFNTQPPPNYIEATNLFTRNVYRAWRTWGITGGMVNWHEQSIFARILSGRPTRTVENPNPRAPGFHADYRHSGVYLFHEAWDEQFWKYTRDTGHLDVLREVNRPLLAYLGGKPGRFTAKDHHFFVGDTVNKQIILINDHRRERTVDVQVEVELAGKRLRLTQGNQGEKVTLAVGETRKIPIAFDAPALRLTDKSYRKGVIRLRVREAGRKDIEDEFVFQVLQPAKVHLTGSVGLFDPAERSAAVLEKIGCRFKGISKGADLSSYDLVVVGSKALPADPAGALPFDFGDYLAQGGRLLILEQTGEALFHRLGLRVASPCTRRAFVADASHPILQGSTNSDLTDWNGSGTLVDPYPEHRSDFAWPKGWWNGFYNDRPWKWGNYGSVATTLIERGHMPDLVPLAVAEYDLQYSPLLEWRGAKGKAVFFQFDVSDRTEPDPVAQLLLARTLKYMDAADSRTTRRATFYAGDDTGRTLLKQMQVSFKEAGAIRSLPPQSLLIVRGATDVAQQEELASYVQEGGRLFFLSDVGEQDLSWISPGLSTRVANLSRSSGIPDDWFFRGLTLRDLHWRGFMDFVCLQGLPATAMQDERGMVARLPHGKGSYLFCLIDPDDFDVDKRTYLRQSRKNSYSLIARLLANAAAEVNSPIWDYRQIGSFPLNGQWRIRKDAGKSEAAVDVDDSTWDTIQVPGTWEGQLDDYRDFDGTAWYRNRFVVPDDYRGKPVRLSFVADDFDVTCFNGQQIGHTDKQTNPKDYWKATRAYPIPEGLIRYGQENVIAIKVTDVWMAAGITDSIRLVTETECRAGSVYLTDLRKDDDPYRYSKW